MDIEALKLEYQAGVPIWNRLHLVVQQQLGELFLHDDIVLGVPLEGRVKTWESIQEKLERKSIGLKAVTDLDDLVGVRAILLFHSELSRADALIRSTFEVLQHENTGDRLAESQFGYQSRHYAIKLPKAWLAIPTLRGLGDFNIEVQVRTLAQHVWAAASHKLQYKHEKSVPPPVLRTINRISALLETVDLEFDRVLVERTKYKESGASLANEEELNVDNLSAQLDAILPEANKRKLERYDELLFELTKHKIQTLAQLKTLWQKHGAKVLAADAKLAKRRAEEGDYQGTTEERIRRGVYRTHVGLIRGALKAELGDAYNPPTKITRKKKAS